MYYVASYEAWKSNVLRILVELYTYSSTYLYYQYLRKTKILLKSYKFNRKEVTENYFDSQQNIPIDFRHL